MGMLFAVLVILSSAYLYLPVDSWGQKSFKRLGSSDGNSVCATDPPNSVVPLSSSLNDMAFGISSALPLGVGCAWTCMADADCLSYNHNAESKMCEMFFYTPNNTSPNTMCTYFRVSFSHLILEKGNFD